jgi:hypothetical protein
MRRSLRALVVAAFVLAVVGPASAPALAAEVTFSDAQATATYDKSVEFSIQLDTPTAPQRLELRIRLPDTVGPVIFPVTVPSGSGAHRVSGRWDVSRDGHLVPNTRLTGQWVAYAADGSTTTSDSIAVRYSDTRYDWKTVEGDLVRVHWTEGGDAFGQRALKIGEDAIRETSQLLGVEERDPIDFFIYADQVAFRDALGPGTRENVGGQAHSDIRTLFALIAPSEIDDSWVGIVVPHELTHLVFDTAVDNPYRFPPRWLNEGLAVYLSQGYDRNDRTEVDRAARSGDLMPLTALTGQFPTTFDGFSLAYSESASAVDFLVRRHTKDGLVKLVRQYRDGLSDDAAFQAALGEDFATFQAAWFEDLGIAAPKPRGPVPASPGPVPPGWGAPVPASPSPTASEPAAPTASPTIRPSPAASASVEPTAPPPASETPSGGAADLTPILLAVLLIAGAVVLGLVLGRPSGRRP